MRHHNLLLLSLATFAAAVGSAQGAAEGYLRYPDLHGDRVVFVRRGRSVDRARPAAGWHAG